jgi:predicted nucleic acid-binding protein
MKVSVLDTSALVRLYIPDGPVPEGVEAALDGAWRGDEVLLVPELALAEAAQVLLKKEQGGLLSADEARGILEEILTLPLQVVGHADLISSAASLARRLALTVYDALFLALALERGAPLFTGDQTLAAALATAEAGSSRD